MPKIDHPDQHNFYNNYCLHKQYILLKPHFLEGIQFKALYVMLGPQDDAFIYKLKDGSLWLLWDNNIDIKSWLDEPMYLELISAGRSTLDLPWISHQVSDIKVSINTDHLWFHIYPWFAWINTTANSMHRNLIISNILLAMFSNDEQYKNPST